jgi:Fe-S-cluster containining protein
MQNISLDQFAAGLAALRQPILPLVRLVQLLYLTGPFTAIDEVLCQLTEPIDTGAVVYDNPGNLLTPHLAILKEVERLKVASPLPWLIKDENHNELDLFEAVDAWVSQAILSHELEQINSLLCGPCGCTLCCTGPDRGMSQLFFEIPLAAAEIELFSLPRHDSPATRSIKSDDEPPFTVDTKPFYETTQALYHFQAGWSLILPQETKCPHLEPAKGHCQIYPKRPDVCRRPQIFAYILDQTEKTKDLPTFIRRQKLLAVWDCPYVQQFQEGIAGYAALCGVEVIFKQNKI